VNTRLQLVVIGTAYALLVLLLQAVLGLPIQFRILEMAIAGYFLPLVETQKFVRILSAKRANRLTQPILLSITGLYVSMTIVINVYQTLAVFPMYEISLVVGVIAVYVGIFLYRRAYQFASTVGR
jgi:uncharacterized membrane protein